MTELIQSAEPADGHVLTRHAPGLVRPLIAIRDGLRRTLEHNLLPALHLHTASFDLGLLGQDADHVAACYRDLEPDGEHDHQMIRAAEHLAHLTAQIRRAAEAAPPTADSVRMVLGEINRALDWLGTNSSP